MPRDVSVFVAQQFAALALTNASLAQQIEALQEQLAAVTAERDALKPKDPA